MRLGLTAIFLLVSWAGHAQEKGDIVKCEGSANAGVLVAASDVFVLETLDPDNDTNKLQATNVICDFVVLPTSPIEYPSVFLFNGLEVRVLESFSGDYLYGEVIKTGERVDGKLFSSTSYSLGTGIPNFVQDAAFNLFIDAVSGRIEYPIEKELLFFPNESSLRYFTSVVLDIYSSYEYLEANKFVFDKSVNEVEDIKKALKQILFPEI